MFCARFVIECLLCATLNGCTIYDLHLSYAPLTVVRFKCSINAMRIAPDLCRYRIALSSSAAFLPFFFLSFSSSILYSNIFLFFFNRFSRIILFLFQSFLLFCITLSVIYLCYFLCMPYKFYVGVPNIFCQKS